jgi:Zn-dependent protease with chaperone function
MRKETFLEWGRYRGKQIPPVGLSRLVGYDPFEIVRQVSLRAGIVPVELLIVSHHSSLATVLLLGNKAVIVCDKSFVANMTEREFEGVVAHEVGHYMNFEDSLYRFTQHSFVGLLACGTSLFIMLGGALFLGIFLPSEFLVNFSTVAVSASLGAVLLAAACLGTHRVLQKKREFSADKRALSLTRYPWDFVNILSKIASAEDSCVNESRITEVPPVKKFNTHPPMKIRIKVIKQILRNRGVVK